VGEFGSDQSAQLNWQLSTPSPIATAVMFAGSIGSFLSQLNSAHMLSPEAVHLFWYMFVEFQFTEKKTKAVDRKLFRVCIVITFVSSVFMSLTYILIVNISCCCTVKCCRKTMYFSNRTCTCSVCIAILTQKCSYWYWLNNSCRFCLYHVQICIHECFVSYNRDIYQEKACFNHWAFICIFLFCQTCKLFSEISK